MRYYVYLTLMVMRSAVQARLDAASRRDLAQLVQSLGWSPSSLESCEKRSGGWRRPIRCLDSPASPGWVSFLPALPILAPTRNISEDLAVETSSARYRLSEHRFHSVPV